MLHLKLTLAVATSKWIPAFTSHPAKTFVVLCFLLKSCILTNYHRIQDWEWLATTVWWSPRCSLQMGATTLARFLFFNQTFLFNIGSGWLHGGCTGGDSQAAGKNCRNSKKAQNIENLRLIQIQVLQPPKLQKRPSHDDPIKVMVMVGKCNWSKYMWHWWFFDKLIRLKKYW